MSSVLVPPHPAKTVAINKVDFILSLYPSDELNKEERKIMKTIDDKIINIAYDYLQKLQSVVGGNPDKIEEINVQKNSIKQQLLFIIQQLLYDVVWQKITTCINEHMAISIKEQTKDAEETGLRNFTFFRTWEKCCDDKLKAVAIKLAKELNTNNYRAYPDKPLDRSENIHIACSVVISYYLIHAEWDTLKIQHIRIRELPFDMKEFVEYDIQNFTFMCWVYQTLDQTKDTSHMMRHIRSLVMGIAMKQTDYKDINLEPYHKLIMATGEFAHDTTSSGGYRKNRKTTRQRKPTRQRKTSRHRKPTRHRKPKRMS